MPTCKHIPAWDSALLPDREDADFTWVRCGKCNAARIRVALPLNVEWQALSTALPKAGPVEVPAEFIGQHGSFRMDDVSFALNMMGGQFALKLLKELREEDFSSFYAVVENMATFDHDVAEWLAAARQSNGAVQVDIELAHYERWFKACWPQLYTEGG